MNTLISKAIHMPMRGSIQQVEPTITQTNLGHGIKVENDIKSIDQLGTESRQRTKRACVIDVL